MSEEKKKNIFNVVINHFEGKKLLKQQKEDIKKGKKLLATTEFYMNDIELNSSFTIRMKKDDSDLIIMQSNFYKMFHGNFWSVLPSAYKIKVMQWYENILAENRGVEPFRFIPKYSPLSPQYLMLHPTEKAYLIDVLLLQEEKLSAYSIMFDIVEQHINENLAYIIEDKLINQKPMTYEEQLARYNLLLPAEVPAGLYKISIGTEITDEESCLCAVYLNQPANYSTIKAIEDLKAYVELGEHYTGLTDKDWKTFQDGIFAIYNKREELYKKHFGELPIEEFYKQQIIEIEEDPKLMNQIKELSSEEQAKTVMGK